MGLFKGMKDLKDLSQHHGGMPSIRDSFKDIGALADDRGEKEVLKDGVVAKAVVKGFAEPVPGDKFAMHIPLEIHPPNGAPYPVDYVFPTTRMKAAITVGMEIPVKVLPDQPERVAVQWDAQQASIAAAGGDMAAVTSGLQATYGGAADAAMREAQAKQAAEDPAARMQKLTQMRDSGLITPEEFETKKKEILGGI
ncbi:MAG TPA: SHOCT domain-containing protein [Thermoleophilaceae bacterium]|nr:SHOCT domain-containing protein [Thermoleophilaceae bacterium]